jgi:hypothetical protein
LASGSVSRWGFVHREAFEKYEFLFEFEEGDNFYHRNTLGILRINPPKFGGGLKFEPDKEVEQKGMFYKGLIEPTARREGSACAPEGGFPELQTQS